MVEKRAIEIISEDCGDSPKQVQRYISLTKLIPEMLQKLDDEIISFCPAVEIAALNETEQKELLVAMEYAQAIPSLSQAQRIRQLSKEKQLSLEKMEEIMCEVKKVRSQEWLSRTSSYTNIFQIPIHRQWWNGKYWHCWNYGKKNHGKVKGGRNHGYGRLRKAYLEMYRPILFNELVLSDKLFEHCAEIDEAAWNRIELIVRSLAEQNDVTEQLKAENQMEWVRQMNACKAQAEEIVKAELIYDWARKSGQKTVRTFLIYSKMTVELFTSFMV